MSCPRCGIDPTGCQCQATDTDCFEVTGDGSEGSPFQVNPIFAPSASGLLSCTPEGLLAELPTEVAAPPSGQLFSTTSQSIPGGSVATVVGFNGVRYSNGVTVDLANNRFVITVPGVYVLIALVGWQPTITGDMTTQIRIDKGAIIVGLHNTRSLQFPSSNPPIPRYQRLIVQEELVVGDVIRAVVSQSSGSSVSLATDRSSPILSIAWKREPT